MRDKSPMYSYNLFLIKEPATLCKFEVKVGGDFVPSITFLSEIGKFKFNFYA
jgi:hypothetical protein